MRLFQTIRFQNYIIYFVLMLDLVEEIEDYSPQHQPAKQSYNDDKPSLIAKAPLIDTYNQSNISNQKEAQKKEQDTSCMRFFKLSFYEEFFKVSELQVLERIKSAIIPPYKQYFLEQVIKDNPDFYGPFWIMTTIFFLLGFVGNFANYINYKIDSDIVELRFSLQNIRYAFVMIYSFGIASPLVLFLTLKFMGNELKLPDIICIYGYSLVCFIPALMLCVIPLEILQWLFLIYAFANSTFFLIISINKSIEGIRAKSITVFCVIGAIQLTLFLCSKLIFFG